MFIVDDGSDNEYGLYIEALLEDYFERHIGDYNVGYINEKRLYDIDVDRTIILSRVEHFGHPSPVRNSVLNFLQGELVCFRDDDGFWDKSYLEKMQQPFVDPEVVMVYCNRNITHFDNLYKFKQHYDHGAVTGAIYNPQYEGQGRFKAGADTGDVMLRTSVFKAVDGFDSPEETGGQEDLYLWGRVAQFFPQGKVIHVDEALNYYIWHQSEFPNRTMPES
jgi:hypothetical protein